MPATISPEGGRLCKRARRDGSALVGIMHLPACFVPVEGASYALQESPHGLMLHTKVVRDSIPEHMQSYGVGALLTSNIWNKTQSADVMIVRFISAMPENNTWTVFGASNHPEAKDQTGHSWFDINASGQMISIEPPFEAMGEGIGQLLSSYPVWPDRRGDMHTVPQIQTRWRAHYLDFHKLLVEAARNPDVDATLEATIGANPNFREIQLGRVDREFCQYLSKLDERGLMILDGVKTAEYHEEQSRAAGEIIDEILGDRNPRRSHPGP